MVQLADDIAINGAAPASPHAAADALETAPAPSCIVASAATVAAAKQAVPLIANGLAGVLLSAPANGVAHLVLGNDASAQYAPAATVQGTADVYIHAADLPGAASFKTGQYTAQTARCTTDPDWGAPFIVFPQQTSNDDAAAARPQYGPQRGIVASATFDTTVGQCETTFRTARLNAEASTHHCSDDPACTGIVPPQTSMRTSAAPLVGFAQPSAANSVQDAVVVQPWPEYAADIAIPPSGANYNPETAQIAVNDRNAAWAQHFTALQIADATTTQPPEAINVVQLNYETRRKPTKNNQRQTQASVALSSTALAVVLIVGIAAVAVWARHRISLDRPAAFFKFKAAD